MVELLRATGRQPGSQGNGSRVRRQAVALFFFRPELNARRLMGESVLIGSTDIRRNLRK